jgi:hypothetical protein
MRSKEAEPLGLVKREMSLAAARICFSSQGIRILDNAP